MKIRAGTYIVLIAGGMLTAFPFVWMLCTSLKDSREATAPSLSLIPEDWHWRNFPDAFNAAPFATYFYNTFFVAGITTASVLLTALLAGPTASLRVPCSP